MAARVGRVDRLTARALLAGTALLLIALPFSNALVEIASGLLFVAALFAGARGRLRVPWFIWGGLGAWLGVSLVSVLYSTDVRLSVEAWLYKTSEYALFYLVAAHLGGEPRRVRWLLCLLAVCAGVMALDALYQGAVGHDLIRGRGLVHGSRLMGPFTNPNNLASYLLMAVPIQFGWWLGTRRALVRMGLGILLLLEGVVLIGCDARSAWVVLGVALTTCLFASGRVLWAGLIGVGGLAGMLARGGAGLAMFHQLDPGRREGWSVAWSMFLDDPWTGIGWGRFMANYGAYLPATDPSVRIDWARPQYAHNCYLQILAEGGLFSLAAFLYLVAASLYGLMGRLRALRAPMERGLLAGLLGALVAGLLNIGFDTGLYSLPITSLFWTLLGLAAGVGASSAEASSG